MSGETSTTLANDILAYIYNSSTALATLLAGSSLYVSLHTADPGAGGSQSTSEVSYTGYARVAITRASAAAVTVSGNVATLAAALSFPACTAGTATATNFAIGTAASGAGNILHTGPISPSISISNGVTPQLTTGTTITQN